MAIKRTDQRSFAEALLPAKAGANASLERLAGLVKWYRFEKLIGHLRDEASAGRPGYPVLVLLKALILQSLYGLSDRELEEALNDRLSFKRFVGLGLEADCPDHTVLNRFRNRLVAEGLLERLFAELDGQLEKAGLVLRKGAMLDATLIASAAARPDKDGASSDPDARFGGKGGRAYGYKAHVNVDEGSGLIRTVIATPGNVNDTTPADGLLRGDERAVLADSAYHSHRRQRVWEARGLEALLMLRANKHHDLDEGQKRYNAAITSRRWAVETTFATLKNRMGLRRIRYRGLAKAAAQIILAAIAFNMRRWTRPSPA